jgi:hypothetical protein
MGENLAEQISARITKLRTLSRQQLLALWTELYIKDPPEGMRRELLVPFLAYKIQENAFGGLKSGTRAELRRVVSGLEKPTRPSRHRIQAGTRLLRQWRGETHEIAVTDAGFEYRGTHYESLSEIARRITGTRWSGPAFFGLRKLRSPAGGHDD